MNESLERIVKDHQEWLGPMVDLVCRCCGLEYRYYENSNSAHVGICGECWYPCAEAGLGVRHEK